MRRASKVDANQKEIIAALRQVGCSVTSLATVGNGVPDLLVGRRRKTFLLEVKNPFGRNIVHKEQQDWHAEWQGGPVLVVRNILEALEAVGARVN